MHSNLEMEKTLPSLLDSKVKPVNPKRNQLWIFFGSTDAEAEASKLWSPDAKSQLVGKDPDAGKDWRQEEKGATEDEMVGWHHLFNGHEFEQTPGDSKRQGSLVSYNPWGRKESDTTQWLNNNNHEHRKRLWDISVHEWWDQCLVSPCSLRNFKYNFK